jgi:uncharacterized protein (DUF427 family)
MAIRMRDAMFKGLDGLRYEPVERRVRALLGDDEVVDSRRPLFVWEPRRVVPSFAVPIEDVRGELVPATSAAEAPGTSPPILHPGIGFETHSAEGESLSLRAGDSAREGVAFAPADPDLAGHVILDFRAFDPWYEENELLLGHPRDPYHRVDARRSSRHVRIERDGHVLAETSRPTLVFETSLPVRFYLPPQDLRAEARASDRRTTCAYKGHASYWSFDALGDDGRDLAWSYEQPLADAAQLTGLVGFFDELVDVVVDGDRRERPNTPVARAIVEEARSGPASA